MKKISISVIIAVLVLFVGINVTTLAADKFNTTSDINGVTANWEYTLDDSGNIKELRCTNPGDLAGNITVPGTLDGKNVVSIGRDAFKSATNITGVTISSQIKEIGYSAFEGCTSLTSIDLGRITDISFDVFKGCTSLTSITIPKTLKRGSASSSLNNLNITNITFEEGLTIIPQCLCKNTGISSIKIPDSVEEIGYEAFENCPNLTNVDLGKIKSISFDIFKDCPKLTSITIPNTLENGIYTDGVFTGSTNLTSVTFENGINQIPAGILHGCSGITAVVIPDSVKSIKAEAFQGTSISEIDIPNSVTEIEYYAFKECPNLKKITILDNCSHMGWHVLYPNDDTVFNDHDKDLTIYCYEDSYAAEYAISTNIKYVYIGKKSTENKVENVTHNMINTNTNTQNRAGNTSRTNNTSNTSNTVTPRNKDNTVSNTILPYTGNATFKLVVLVGILIVSVIVYKKYKELKEV